MVASEYNWKKQRKTQGQEWKKYWVTVNGAGPGSRISEKELGNTHYMKPWDVILLIKGIFLMVKLLIYQSQVWNASLLPVFEPYGVTDFSSRIVIVTSLLCLHISTVLCVYVLFMPKIKWLKKITSNIYYNVLLFKCL